VVEGRLPTRARRLVEELASLHQHELMAAWVRAQRSEPPGRIAPLEQVLWYKRFIHAEGRLRTEAATGS